MLIFGPKPTAALSIDGVNLHIKTQLGTRSIAFIELQKISVEPVFLVSWFPLTLLKYDICFVTKLNEKIPVNFIEKMVAKKTIACLKSSGVLVEMLKPYTPGHIFWWHAFDESIKLPHKMSLPVFLFTLIFFATIMAIAFL